MINFIYLIIYHKKKNFSYSMDTKYEWFVNNGGTRK